MPLKKPRPSEMCKPGYHAVKAHRRLCRSGVATRVKAHIAKNPGKRLNMLLPENILYLFWTSKENFKALKPISGFAGEKGAEYDAVIQFWLNYWNAQGLDLEGIDPMVIKTMIAVESSFNPAAKAGRSTARGLLQLLDGSRTILRGSPGKDGIREIKDHFLVISDKEVFDPVINICAGIRWLAHKRRLVSRRGKNNLFNTLKSYHSLDARGDTYAKKVLELYEKSK